MNNRENNIHLPGIQTSRGQSCSFDPILWSEYFNVRDDILLELDTFRIYRRGVQGPLLFLLHGGGFSALTWSIFSARITEQVHCQCLAVDLRGHGDTHCQNDEDLSIETLAKDVIKIIFAMYPTEAPPIILIGHRLTPVRETCTREEQASFHPGRGCIDQIFTLRQLLERRQTYRRPTIADFLDIRAAFDSVDSMGGAVAIHVANLRKIPSLAGLAVIDVVEGSAISALSSMSSFLESRPKSFVSLSQAIEWSVRSSQLRNLQSARVSFPGQLKRIGTNQTATSELDSGVAVVNTVAGRDKVVPTNRHCPTLSRLKEDSNDPVPDSHQTAPRAADDDSSHSRAATSSDRTNIPLDKRQSSAEYTWRIDLMKTKPFWNTWFSGLSKMFLSISEPKLLLLANTDQLDRDLMIGQMQGRFQVNVFPKAGHAVHEDLPDKVTECLVRFLVRNRISEPLSNRVN